MRSGTGQDGKSACGRKSSAITTRALVSALLGSTILVPLPIASASAAWAQGAPAAARPVSFSIPAQPLASALDSFSRTSGWQVGYTSALVQGRTSRAISGAMSPSQALASMLAGAGVNVRLTGPTTATLVDSSAAAPGQGDMRVDDGSLVLDTININGAGGQTTVYTPFETPGAVNYISAEQIERYRGNSPSDMFRGTPGVLSGDARNSGGAIDVNIRGLQGQGRVKVTIDDAENAVTVYQGYQGQSNRTYVDPDFISSIDINKGMNVASRGAAGSVEMRTISASDIVKAGDTWGVRVKGGFGGNTTAPTSGAQGGYAWPTVNRPTLMASQFGMDRPSFLTPTSGSGSAAAAMKQENWDFIAGYAYRKQGNYFAGANGGEGLYAYPVMSPITGRYVNGGNTNYRPGEEVLNTELQTRSWLAKANFRFGDGHSLRVGYNGYRGEAGNWLPNVDTLYGVAQTPYRATTGVRLDTGSASYRWNPENNDYINLKATAWLSYYQFLNDARLSSRQGNVGSTIWPTDIGLDANYRTGTNTVMWGGDLSNTSTFTLNSWGKLDLTYGASWLSQDVRLGRYAQYMSLVPPSSGTRDEYGVYGKAAWKPVDWLTLNAGLRYSRYWADGPESQYQLASGAWQSTGPAGNAGGLSPSAGVTVEPFKGLQFYANYSSALRLPSLMETVGVFTVVEPGLKPERLKSWDLGVNLLREGVFTASDTAMFKLGWFNWNVNNYIARNLQAISQGSALRIHNIAGAKFQGFEFSGRYENAGFTASLGANYFTKVEYCATSETCGNQSLYGDYATNYVPPEYTINLSLSQKFMDDRLTIGGRVYHVGPRAAGHGANIAQGAQAFIAMIDWKPYTLVDIFAEYKVTENLKASFRVENLTDQFYVDPLGLLQQPSPGRTFLFSLQGDLGGSQPLPYLTSPLRNMEADGKVNWTGVYGGFHGGYAMGRITGTSTPLKDSAFAGAAYLAASEAPGFNPAGGLLGVQAGYNWQFANRIVAGVEAEWSKSWVEGRQDNLAADDATVAAAYHLQSRLRSNIDWSAALRARVGYAFDSGLLLYGSAGVAMVREKFSRDQHRILGQILTRPAGDGDIVTWVDQDGTNRVGVTAGFGGEYAINERWSVKLDYGWSRFGDKGYDFANARAGAGGNYQIRTVIGTNPLGRPIYRTTNHAGGYPIMNGRRMSTSMDLQTIKLGLNYRF